MAIKKTKHELFLLQECKSVIEQNPNLKRRKLNKIKDLDKRLYYLKVWSITESQPLHKLRNHSKRCFYGKNCYHLDHMCSISKGFYENIPPEVIGRIDNLKFIPANINMKKGAKVTKYRLEETLRKSRKFKQNK